MKRFYEFAAFRLDTKQCRLTRGETTISLTPKEYEVLLFLLENAGRVVDKNELLDAVWKDTFVEEGTLTRNISWLRKKLVTADSGTKIIETLPKRGYRFLPEITKHSEGDFVIEDQSVQHIQIEEIIEILPDGDENSIIRHHNLQTNLQNFETSNSKNSDLNLKALPAAPVKRRSSLLRILPFVIISGILLLGAYWGFFSKGQSNVVPASKITPFSGLPGREDSPAFSPDGNQMVFSWDGGAENGNSDIYVKVIGAGDPLRLTTDAADEINPVFSPDGKSIAFVRILRTYNEIILMSALGGSEQIIYDQAGYGSISFSPDGKSLAVVELGASKENPGIYLIDLQSKAKTRLTTPDAPAVDHTPRFSPDGKNLAFIRYFSPFHREIFVVSADGGQPRQITSDDVRIYGLVWSPDNQKLFFTSYRNTNRLGLWQVVLGGEPQLIETGSRDLQSLAISPDGRTIAFVEEKTDENIWQIAPDNVSRPIIRSTHADHSEQFSPDGRQIAFASDRTGNDEIWIADADGKNQRQLTNSAAQSGSPRFSPDGKFIAFDAQTADSSDVYIISVNGGAAQRLTEANGKVNSLPAWSIDGKWIFFRSNRMGSHQIWKMPATGGEATQITLQGAFEMFAAPDGKRIIYTKGSEKSGLWQVNTTGGGEEPIPELAEAGGWRSWTVAPNGVYYTSFATQPPFRIKFFDFAAHQTEEIVNAEKPPLTYYSNLSVAPDGKRILYARQDQSASSIMLADLH